MKALLVLLIVAILINQSFAKSNPYKRRSRLNQNKSNKIECPACGLRNRPGLPGTSALECKRFYLNNDKNENDPSKENIPRLPSYKCKCNYTSVNKKKCGFNSPKNVKEQPKRVTGDCLVAHVGMAIRGHNLIYRKWVDKENCFNQCMRTRIKNGDAFNCVSFEHWHKNCDSTNVPDNPNRICASFDEDKPKPNQYTQLLNSYNVNYFKKSRNYYRDEYIRKAKANSKRASRTDICVLSNQTIAMAPNEFLPNHVVTYYEILCIEARNLNNTDTIPMTNTNTNTRDSHDEIIFTRKPTIIPSIKTNTRKPANNDNYYSSNNDNKNFEIFTPSTTIKTPESPITHISGKQCQFNPCLNNGACLLIDTFRFTCLCKDFYYGVYCEILGIQKVCHRTLMEITIDNELADNLNIQISDLFVNRKTNHLSCQLNEMNTTHSRFSIPYGSCSTIKSNINGEVIYTNKLFSQVKKIGPINSIQSSKNDYLMTLECTVSPNTPQTTPRVNLANTIPSYFPKSTLKQTMAPMNKKSCMIDLFQLRMRIYFENNYRLEYSNVQNKVDYDDNINVQFFVDYSRRLNELYQMQERLQYMHLTLLHCWLTSTENSYKGVKQILVENGCPRRGVYFFDSSQAKNSIQFSFKIKKPVKNDSGKYYLQCDPEICTDPAPRYSKADEMFYRRFKLCQNISAICDNRNKNDGYTIQTPEMSEEYLKRFNPKMNMCNSTLVEGPLYISNEKNLNTLRANLASKNKNLGYQNTLIFILMQLGILSIYKE